MIGVHVDAHALMLHALVTTRDGATVGPHRSPRGTVLTGNIRIDDQRTLRAALAAAGGDVPPLGADEALVLAAWECWGERCLAHLLGDFAFVLWDPAAQRGIAARDALGMRPLFHARVEGGIVCASSIPVLRAHPEVSARLHDPSIASLLAYDMRMDPERTTFEDVHRLPAGHLLRLGGDADLPRPVRYWTPPAPAPTRLREDEVVDATRALLDEVVRDRLRLSKVVVPLSGGLDSPGLLVTARRARPDIELVAFTLVDPTRGGMDEAPLAAMVAARHGVRHVIREERLEGLRFGTTAHEFPAEPTGNICHLYEMRVLRAMAELGNVQLNGEDGDALLMSPDLGEEIARFGAWRTLTALFRFGRVRRRRPDLGLRWRARWEDRGEGTTFPPWMRAEWHASVLEDPPMPRTTRPRLMQSLMHPHWQEMAEGDWGVECGLAHEPSWPLMDLRLVEFVMGLPMAPWLQRKELWRRVFRDALPPEILTRAKTSLSVAPTSIADRWRAEQQGRPPVVSDRVARWVDPARVNELLRSGSGAEIGEAWRALGLDAWLRATLG